MSTLRRETHSLYLTSRKRNGVIPLVELKEFPTFRLHIFFSLHYSCSYSHILSLPLCAKYILGNVKSNSRVLTPCPSSISIFLVPAIHLDVLQIPSLCLPSVPAASSLFLVWILVADITHTPSSKWGCPFFARLIDKLWYSSLKCSYSCFLMILALITISHGTQHGQLIFLYSLFSFQSKVTS